MAQLTVRFDRVFGRKFMEILLICLWKCADSDNESRVYQGNQQQWIWSGMDLPSSRHSIQCGNACSKPLDVWEPRVHKLVSLMN